ncbi:MAG: hypothetical protein GY949_12515 [Gammaproteobacteria bacterium]|nr:hypothetical protein [Gammaproteobacteria bacterium]
MKLAHSLALAALLSLSTPAAYAQPTEDCDAVGATATTDDDCPLLGSLGSAPAIAAATVAVLLVTLLDDDTNATTTSTVDMYATGQ